jgi:mannitol/fructose-specific phosphotransferase system IIA component (Ntr-type)
MKDAVYRYGPYVVLAPGIALLHARPDDGVNRICMSLVTLNPPIPFHHPHNDPVRLAFGICVIDHHSHIKALAELANLLGDSERIAKIESASSPAEVISIVKGQA